MHSDGMDVGIAFIGFGEAANTFAAAMPTADRRRIRAYDIKTLDPAQARDKHEDYRRAGIAGTASAPEAIDGAAAILSLVTPRQALAAARAVAETALGGALYFDFNSVAPQTKHMAARLVEAAGGRYVDVAMMAPVDPAALAIPLLLSGPHADDGAIALREIGFTNSRVSGVSVGDASAVKMLRSVIVKGLEALTTECFLAASAAGVADDVAASLHESWPGFDWSRQADYNLERMAKHGLRRAAEMEEAVATLEGLGADCTMSRATVAAQWRIGAMGLAADAGLADTARALVRGQGEAA